MHDENQSENEKVLKSVVRAERLPDPTMFVQPILDRVERKHIYDVYGIPDWVDDEDFLKQLAMKTGKLLKGGEPDLNNLSRQIIVDWQRGRLPYVTPPPKNEQEEEIENKKIEVDPKEKNPLEQAQEAVELTKAQNEIMA